MKELKDIFKPPFRLEDHSITDSKGMAICKIFNWVEYTSTINHFLLEALNEKAEREWGERKQWELTNHTHNKYRCPKCREVKMRATNYCPSRGVRLDPPKED